MIRCFFEDDIRREEQIEARQIKLDNINRICNKHCSYRQINLNTIDLATLREEYKKMMSNCKSFRNAIITELKRDN